MYEHKVHGYKLRESAHCHTKRVSRGITLKDIKHQLKWHREVTRYKYKKIAIVDAFQSIILIVRNDEIYIITAIDDMLTNADADIVLSDC